MGILQRYVKASVDKYITEAFTLRQNKFPPGFYPLDQWLGAAKLDVWLPYGAMARPCTIRFPGAGETADLEKIQIDRIEKKDAQYDLYGWINSACKIAKAMMVSPTYDEAEQSIIDAIPAVKAGREAYKRIEARFLRVAKVHSCPLEDCEQYSNKEDWKKFVELSRVYDCLLPSNFISALSMIALGRGFTDADALTEDMLVNCYNLAKSYNKAPHEFTPVALLSGAEAEFDAKAYLVWKARQKNGR
jgi:hypothetical protein